ncbi:hypothetical protein CDAR_589731 [Caerostris darwini]|uniref:Uncharacterized protein n=1 Tax=Caerostris darwini TaxID=1538125 RepID=A0AAV4PFH8_9ARAC|nr:hypothetical protein CDAR_589731 [Caerostris darwini]
MNKFAIFLAFVSVFAGTYVNADCDEEFNAMKKHINSMIDDETAPKCVFELDLAQFKCTGGDDPEEDEKKEEAFMEHLSNLSDEDKKKVTNCMQEVAKIAIENTGTSEECIKQMKEDHGEMFGDA